MTSKKFIQGLFRLTAPCFRRRPALKRWPNPRTACQFLMRTSWVMPDLGRTMWRGFSKPAIPSYTESAPSRKHSVIRRVQNFINMLILLLLLSNLHVIFKTKQPSFKESYLLGIFSSKGGYICH